MLENPSFFQKFFEETFPTTYTEMGSNEFLQLKKHVPHLKCFILFYRVNRKGADFTNMLVCVSKSCQKS